MGSIGTFLGTLFGPIGTIFHAVCYEPIFNLLMLIYNGYHTIVPGPAFGLAIITLTLAIRLALIPLTRRQLKSTQAMQALQPELKKLQAQYKNDPQRLMAEQQALYKQHGVSPASGCLPLLIQMPFLYALFYSFLTALNQHDTNAQRVAHINKDIYPFLPHIPVQAIIHTQFLWTDLAKPDQWHILPIMAGVLTLVQLRMAMPVKKPLPAGAPRDATTQATQTTQYIMPLITTFFAWQYAAGLALYWTVGTAFAGAQQYFINGNFGSLFIGIPGMERYVPAPKEPPTMASLSRTPRVVASSDAPVAVAAIAEEGEVGIMGFFRRLGTSLNSATAQARAAQEAQAAGSASAVVERPRVRVAEADQRPASAATRRPRPSRNDAPLLIKRSTETPAPPTKGDDASAFVVEPTPANGTNGAGTNGHTNGNGNGANGGATTGKPATATHLAASGYNGEKARTGAATGSGNATRKGGGNGASKSGSSARARSASSRAKRSR